MPVATHGVSEMGVLLLANGVHMSDTTRSRPAR